MPANPAERPLSNIRVLDLSRVLAGPWAAQFLADMGAEVIKVERPGEGDDTRGWGPPFLVEPAPGRPGYSAYYASTNRGKRSLTVDMAHPEGQALLRDIAAKSDVLIENFKVGGLVKYGLDYASLSAVNPRLVYCSITGFGQTGPYAARAGYDFLVQGMGGLMSITGEKDGEPGAQPMKVGVAISDQVAGLNALAGILTALVARERTGRGEHIDVALLETTIAALANQGSTYLMSGAVPGRLGNAHPTVVPYAVFPTADGHMILAIGNDGQFQRFCETAGEIEPAVAALHQDARFAKNPARIANRVELTRLISLALGRRTTLEWVALLERKAVPCGPINSIDMVYADPHVVAREMRVELAHPALGPVAMARNPVRFAGAPTTAETAPPTLGQDTEAVLGEVLGLDGAELARLRAAGVI
jgi:crotonobetainyl-CoA:carnitine CoA-transferase CaiB-like acyl-CoA transferase